MNCRDCRHWVQFASVFGNWNPMYKLGHCHSKERNKPKVKIKRFECEYWEPRDDSNNGRD